MLVGRISNFSFSLNFIKNVTKCFFFQAAVQDSSLEVIFSALSGTENVQL